MGKLEWINYRLNSDQSHALLSGHGNRALQYDREHIFSVVIAGASNINVPYFECNEIRGDGCYVNRADPLNDSSPPKNIKFGTVRGFNKDKDGRNLVSIVCCDIGFVEDFYSENIGGIVGGVLQPGGIDIEPNAGGNFFVRNFVINRATVINAGDVGIGFVSDPTASPKQIRDCHILNATLRGGGTVKFIGASRCSVNITIDSLAGNALMLEGSELSRIRINANGFESTQVGLQFPVYDSDIDIQGDNIRNAGAIVGWMERCSFKLKCNYFAYSPTGNKIGLWFRDLNSLGNCVQRDNEFNVLCAAISGANYAIQYDTTKSIAFLGANKLCNGIFTGFSDFTHIIGNAGRYLYKSEDILGLTRTSSMPNNGIWRAEDLVKCSSPTFENKI